MKERPILFSAPMVKALLAGTKTQTRRVVKPQPVPSRTDLSLWGWHADDGMMVRTDEADGDIGPRCPYGQPGDRLWVRETWQTAWSKYGVIYRADADDDSHLPKEGRMAWRPSIYMPRNLSRITLEITAVRVERLQEINRGDAMEEGCPFQNLATGDDPRQWYADLWQQINGPGSWDANPWVWVLEFQNK